MRFLVLFFLVFYSTAQAFELLVVQTVSSTKKSFITRNGARSGVIENMTGTFTADNVAVIARARTVTSAYTQWELVNADATIPFEPGTMVTYHAAEEYLWSLNPEAARLKYISDLRPKVRQSFLVKGAATKGLNETVSEAVPQDANRGGIAFDALYERLLHPNFAFDAGARYEREIVNVPGGSVITQRAMLVGDILYYFSPVEDFHNARFYLGLGLGYGQSSTEADGIVQSGFAILLPSTKLGMSLPFNQEWDFLLEGAFESLKTEEKLESGQKQTVNQSNVRVAIGLRKYF